MNADVNYVILCYSYQDTHNRAYYMVLAGTRWLGIRLDLLSALLIGAVALFAAFYSHNNGKEVFYITLFYNTLLISWRGKKWSPGIFLDHYGLNFLFEMTVTCTTTVLNIALSLVLS